MARKTQVLSFGGKRVKDTKSEQDLKAIAKIIVDDLQAGRGVAACKRKADNMANTV